MNATYRFILSENMADELHVFAKCHQYDDNKTYKAAWEEWVDNNDDLINNEKEQLTKNGYQGDIMTKLYKSGRYYYRTKLNVETKPATRRKYVPLSNEFISLINRHIEMQQDNLELKPSTGFDDFCKIYIRSWVAF